jgi:hypothetical protein
MLHVAVLLFILLARYPLPPIFGPKYYVLQSMNARDSVCDPSSSMFAVSLFAWYRIVSDMCVESRHQVNSFTES